MNEMTYFTFDDVIAVYDKTIEHSGGGFSGVRDENAIRSVLDFVQNDMYYPTFEDKLSYLVYRFCTGHFFNDGNKRISLTLGVAFLLRNNRYWAACTFMKRAEAVIYHVAAGNIDDELLLKCIKHYANCTQLSEELQIELAKAINNGTLFVDEK